MWVRTAVGRRKRPGDDSTPPIYVVPSATLLLLSAVTAAQRRLEQPAIAERQACFRSCCGTLCGRTST